jgi:NADH-quinone oxidoreductase subunit K
MSVGPTQVAVLSGIVFAIGAFGLISRRDAFGLLISVAILLLAPVIAFAGFTSLRGGVQGPPQGEVVAVAALVACASMTVIGAALVALMRRRRESLDTDEYLDVEAGQHS